MMKCQQKSTVRYLMKPIKDCIFRLVDRLKSQIISSVNVPPFTWNFKERLGHAAGFQEMEQPEQNNTDDNQEYTEDLFESEMNVEFGNREDPFEFVDVVDRTSDQTGNHLIGPNWDSENVENDSAEPEVNPFPSDNLTNNEHEQNDSNFDHLRVQPDHNEDMGECTVVSEQCSKDDSINTLSFIVTIDNLAAFTCRPERRLASDQFFCRGFPFYLMVENRAHGLAMAAFICRAVTDNEIYDSGLEIVAECGISILDQIDNTYKNKRFFTHAFRAGSDFGFSNWLDRHYAQHLQASGAGILHNNSMIIRVEMKAHPPNCYNNSSKAVTGFVGIRNQGATCYMNSLLQVLYFLNKLRTACYRIPTEMDDKSSMALALQKVFYNLEFSDSPVCTKNLTKSFGWSSVEVLMQQDVQEMMRLLIDRIESRMKNTLLEPILPSMIQGKFISYVKCRDIEFSSQREEVFYDIQLSLENSTNLYESFKRYVSPEMMDDENKYNAGNHGLQAAEKGTLFMSLPPVMFLHLLRFQFDGALNQVTKNNNFFEFYEHINLNEFVREDESTDWKYTLFAVLSHSGGGSHGHYVAYINPSLKGEWFKFDDDTISIVSACDAIESNFGSNKDVDEWTKSIRLNAYMLVYVRDNMADDVFEPTDPKYISEELKSAMQCGERERYSKNYTDTAEVSVLLNTLLESDVSLNLTTIVDLPRFSVNRNLTTSDFKKILLPAFKLSEMDQIRVWRLYSKDNYSFPVYLYEENPLLQTSEIRDSLNLPRLAVWVEMALPGEVLPPFDPNDDVLVFYNYYCAKECRQLYIHHGYHDKNSSIAELITILNKLMEWTDRELNIYQLFRNTNVRELDMSRKFEDCVSLSHGTLVMHIVFEPKEHDMSTKFNSIPLYYQDILCRVGFVARKWGDNSTNEEYFVMSLESTFPELLDLLARRLNYDKMKIQIFSSHCDNIGSAVLSSSTDTLRSLFEYYNRVDGVKLFYKLHTVDVIDVETKQIFCFQWLSIDMKDTSTLSLYLSDDETIESILCAAEKLIESDQIHGSGKFRALMIGEDLLSIVNDATEIYNYIEELKELTFHKSLYVRIEEIPKGDEILQQNEQYVPVFPSRHRVQPRLPPYPFMFKIDRNESWQCIKDRLRTRLNVSERNWTAYSPSVSSSTHWDLEMDDAKCFNDIVQESPETISICLNKAKSASKPRRPSNKLDMISSLC